MAQSTLSTRLARPTATEAAAGHWLILTFAVAIVVFVIVPSFLSAQLFVYPLMKVEDVFVLLTPLVLIPLYWLLLKQAAGERIGLALMLPFLILSALWVDGHGMHLAANSIGHLIDEGPAANAAGQLTYFSDEVLGHYLWHIGLIGLAVLLVAAEWPHPVRALPSTWALSVAAFIYGVAFFLIVDEGQTAPLGLPFVALFSVWGFIFGRKQLGSHPLLTFFLVSSVIATLLFAAWGIYWGGLPEFSEVGIIK